jgi:hypothetical protein
MGQQKGTLAYKKMKQELRKELGLPEENIVEPKYITPYKMMKKVVIQELCEELGLSEEYRKNINIDTRTEQITMKFSSKEEAKEFLRKNGKQ